MEVFSIDGRQTFRSRENDLLLESSIDLKNEKIKSSKNRALSAFRFRKKSVVTVVYLNILKRKRMLELVDLNFSRLN